MQHACTPILVGVVSPVSEILILLKVAKFPFLTMDYSPWSEGKIWLFWRQTKEAITPKPERPHPPKLVSMHFTSTSTCMNFLSRFYFLTPMDYSPWLEGKFWPFLKANKRSHNSETRETTPTKIGFHAFQVNLYLHEFFESILFFDPHGLWSEGKIWPFLEANKRSHNSKTKKTTPTKIGFHAFHVNLYLHEFFEPILFFDPIQYWLQRTSYKSKLHVAYN